jgi:hypothetical protein
LAQKFNSDFCIVIEQALRERIVLIGVTALSVKDVVNSDTEKFTFFIFRMDAWGNFIRTR